MTPPIYVGLAQHPIKKGAGGVVSHTEDEQGRPKLLRGAAKDHPILGQPRSLKGKAAHPQRQPS